MSKILSAMNYMRNSVSSLVTAKQSDSNDTVDPKEVDNPNNDLKIENEQKCIDPIDDRSADEEKVKQSEGSMLIVLKEARRRFIARGLVGKIDIASSLSIFRSSISCEIKTTDVNESSDSSLAKSDSSEDDLKEASENQSPSDAAKEKEKLRIIERIVLSYLDGVLCVLETRAKSYKSCPFADDVSLCSGVLISDPIFGSISFAIYLTATVASILKKT